MFSRTGRKHNFIHLRFCVALWKTITLKIVILNYDVVDNFFSSPGHALLAITGVSSTGILQMHVLPFAADVWHSQYLHGHGLCFPASRTLLPFSF